MDSNNLKIGQKVFSLKYGWGQVIQCENNPVVINFGNNNIYTYGFMNGKAYPIDVDFTITEEKDFNWISSLKNDLMTVQEKEEYDSQIKENIVESDSFIL